MQLNVGANVGAAVVGASVFGIAPYLYLCPNAVATRRGCNAATGLRQTARRGISDAIPYRITARSFADIRTHAYVFAVTHHIMVTPVPAVDESEVKMTVMLRSRE
jgi:hypothetical protein